MYMGHRFYGPSSGHSQWGGHAALSLTSVHLCEGILPDGSPPKCVVVEPDLASIQEPGKHGLSHTHLHFIRGHFQQRPLPTGMVSREVGEQCAVMVTPVMVSRMWETETGTAGGSAVVGNMQAGRAC